MDLSYEEKLAASRVKYRASLQRVQQQQRGILPLPTNFVERPTHGGKRMRLQVTETAVDETVDPETPSTSQVTERATGNQLQELQMTTVDQKGPEYLIYPARPGGLSIYPEDLTILKGNGYLNDRLVNFMMTWAYDRYIPEERHKHVQVCNSFMYTALTRGVVAQHVQNTTASLVENFERVNSYRKATGPGAKLITVMPVCEDAHWLVLVLLLEPGEGKEKARILIVDSYAKQTRTHAAYILQLYLEYTRKASMQVTIEPLRVQQQANLYDCGVHAIHNTRRLFHFLGKCKNGLGGLTEALNAEPLTSRADIRGTIEAIRKNEVHLQSPEHTQEADEGAPEPFTVEETSQNNRDTDIDTLHEEIQSGCSTMMNTATVLVNNNATAWQIKKTEWLEILQIEAAAREKMEKDNKSGVRFRRTVGERSLRYILRRNFGRITSE